MTTLDHAAIGKRYAPPPGLTGRIDDALRAAGLDLGGLVPEDLAPFDQFHTLGLAATNELAALATITGTDRVLDVGCGIGGPARHLAATRHCTVVGVDLTDAYVELAAHLTTLTRQTDRVSFQRADALHLPFERDTFDVVWTQHVAMNIADRPALYGEMHRVLRRGGRLAIFDVVEGNGMPLHFPVPWADVQAESFLLSADAMRATLEASGFLVREWHDKTHEAAEWLEERRRAAVGLSQPPALGLHLLLGPGFATMIQNFARNVADGRVRLVMTVLEKR